MKNWARSLRLRLLLAGLVAAGLTLSAAMAGLSLLFERHAERQLARELSALAEGIAAQIDRPAGGDWALGAPPGDPRYDRPLSGFYWQISRAEGGAPLLQSRSLWDATLTPPAGAPMDETLFPLPGPGGEALLALSLPVTMPARLGGERLVVMAARNAAELREAAANFRRDLLPFLGVIAIALLAAFAAQVAVGLAPLRRMRARLAAIGSGRAARLGEDGFPSEILPLARELDGLLAQRERDIAAARARAGDLAHGLKTPIQVLLAEAERLEWPMTEAERHETATAVGEATEAMRRHVERELSRARRALRGRADRADPSRVARRLVAVLARTEAGARLDWTVEGEAGARAAIHEDDLAEALGAVMENAARFASARVRVTIAHDGTRDGPRDGPPDGRGVAIIVADDGPGIPPEGHAEALRRGGRLDEAGPGTGLGLAIAREIVEEVGGALSLGPTAPGAMTVTLRLPAGESMTR